MNPWVRLLPVVLPVVTMGVIGAAFFSGSISGLGPARSPMAFPVMMLISVVATALAGRGRRHGVGVDAVRAGYLSYLSDLRRRVVNLALEQHLSLTMRHPDPDMLWTLIPGHGMRERRTTDTDFCVVRVGVGTVPLATRLVAPEPSPAENSDPVTDAALRRFIHTHSTIPDAPITIALRDVDTVSIGGDVTRVRALARAVVCRLAVLHAPDQISIVGVISDRNRKHWDWLKWLPHNEHQTPATRWVRCAWCTQACPRRGTRLRARQYRTSWWSPTSTVLPRAVLSA